VAVHEALSFGHGFLLSGAPHPEISFIKFQMKPIVKGVSSGKIEAPASWLSKTLPFVTTR
jgi:hypothetical protein